MMRIFRRPPDLCIGGAEAPYMLRWFVIPRNRVFNIYLHHVLRDDDDRALHDHPWINLSIVLRGGYREITFVRPPVPGSALPATIELDRKPGSVVLRRARKAHRLTLYRDPETGRSLPSWSLFLTGPNLQSWGFWCPLGRWVHWRDFTTGPHGEVVGKGCET